MRNRILIVEDNIDHIKNICRYLRQYDLYVTKYYSEAIDIAQSEVPDLIITDWELQSDSGDGISLTRELKARESTRHIPIIMATAFTSSDKLEQAYDAGCIDYIRKPCSERELLSRVKAILLYYSIANKVHTKRKRTKVLLLGANPNGTDTLDIGLEFRKIKENLKQIGIRREDFEISIELNVTKDSLFQSLLDERPDIIHFSGHGENGLIYLHDSSGDPQPIENLPSIINTFAGRHTFECIVINSCRSASIIGEIERIPIIGIHGNIYDKISIDFSTGFYKAIAAGENLIFAYHLGLSYSNTDQNTITFKNY